MTPNRLAVAQAALLLALLASTPGCLAHERAGDDAGARGDGGGAGDCGGGPACTVGNQCVCGRCITLDLPTPACDPPCATAQHGDFCTQEGRTCPQGPCGQLACVGGVFRAEMGVCDGAISEDAGLPDTGWCECPAPPPGCMYDGSPCICSHLTCPAPRCGREVCGEGTFCCNASCSLCAPPGTGCIDIACAPDCSPQDAHSNGRCEGSPGWAWDGTACHPLSCSCIGTQCDDIFSTEAECNAYFGSCPGTMDCTPDDARGEGGCAAIVGYAFTSFGCMAISGCSCVGTDCAAVVGRSESACNDAHAGCPILLGP